MRRDSGRQPRVQRFGDGREPPLAAVVFSVAPIISPSSTSTSTAVHARRNAATAERLSLALVASRIVST